MDGSGGYAAIWNVCPDNPLLDQPIVFLGSEGEMGVVAQDFSNYRWLLADGYGSYEAVNDEQVSHELTSDFKQFAEKHAHCAQRSAKEVITAAQQAFTHFEKNHMCNM